MRNLFIYLLLLIASSLMAQNQTVYATKLYVNGKLVNKVSDDPTTITDEEAATLPSAAAVQAALSNLPVGIDSVVYDTGTFAYYSKGTLIDSFSVTINDLGGVDADDLSANSVADQTYALGIVNDEKAYNDSVFSAIKNELPRAIYQPEHGFKSGEPVAAIGNYFTHSDAHYTGRHVGIVDVIDSDSFRVVSVGIVDAPSHGYEVGKLYYVNMYRVSTTPDRIVIPAFRVLDDNTLFATYEAPTGQTYPFDIKGGVFRFYGNSITIGQSANPQATNRWAKRLSDMFFATENNGGIGGTTIQNTVNSTTGSIQANNFIDRLIAGALPDFSSFFEALFIGYVTNDFRSDVGGNYTVQTFAADYRQCLDSVFQSRNYPPENVVLVLDYWLDAPAAYDKSVTNGLSANPATLDLQKEYHDTIVAIASDYGVRMLDPRAPMSVNGGDDLLADGVHPTTVGHVALSEWFYEQLTTTYSTFSEVGGTSFAVVDTVETFYVPPTDSKVGDTLGWRVYDATPEIVERNGNTYLQVKPGTDRDFVYLENSNAVHVVELTEAGNFHPDSSVTIKYTYDRVNASSRGGVIMGAYGHPSSVGVMLLAWGNDLRLFRNVGSGNNLYTTAAGVLSTDTEHKIEWRKIGTDSMSVYVDGVLALEHRNAQPYFFQPGSFLFASNFGNQGVSSFWRDVTTTKTLDTGKGLLYFMKSGNVKPDVSDGKITFNYDETELRDSIEAIRLLIGSGGSAYNDTEIRDSLTSHRTDINTALNRSVDDADADDTNELQTLSVSEFDLTISGGNTVALTVPGLQNVLSNGQVARFTNPDIVIQNTVSTDASAEAYIRLGEDEAGAGTGLDKNWRMGYNQRFFDLAYFTGMATMTKRYLLINPVSDYAEFFSPVRAVEATEDNELPTLSQVESIISAIIKTGTGSPEGTVTADPGTLYLNLSGGTSTTLYVKETGTGNTGWAAK